MAHAQLRQIPERALREAVVNGVAHREWTIASPTVVEHVGGMLRVTSPGGFYGGIEASNIITHPSSSRNTALVELLAALRVAEREGVGVDRMYGDMLRLGCPAPDILEIPGPLVRTVLIGNHADESWRTWLRQLSDPRVISDLRLLMAVSFVVRHGWLDERMLAPDLQVSQTKARDVVNSLADVMLNGDHLLIDVRGVPSSAHLTKALSSAAREALTALEGRYGIRRQWPSREAIASSYAAARGRISSTELGDLIGAHATNTGSILASLEEQGVLAPSRAQRRGAGFHYVFVESEK